MLKSKARNSEDAISYLKSKNFIEIFKQNTRKKDFKKIEQFLEAIHDFSDIPMIFDHPNYIAGYEKCVRELQIDNQNTNDPDVNSLFMRMRLLFDCITELQTENITDSLAKRKILFSFELESFPEEKQEEILLYASEKLSKSLDKINHDLDKAAWFAELEHIRWNAYMRTNGFLCAAKTDKINKLHFDLVSTELLTLQDRIKDI